MADAIRIVTGSEHLPSPRESQQFDKASKESANKKSRVTCFLI